MRRRTRRRHVLGELLVIAVVVALLVAWLGPMVFGRGQGAKEVPPDAPLAEQCPDVPDSASRLTLRASDGRDLGAATVGSSDAATAVVLRHGASQTLCDWLPWAEELAEGTGVRVVLFDRRGEGSSPGDEDLDPEPDDLSAAVARTRADGADEVVLVASSMGNRSTWAALDRIDDVCAVVSVSPALPASASNAVTHVPDSVWVTYETGDDTIVTTSRALLAAAEESGATVRDLGVDTDDHSLALVENHDEVGDFVTEAVASCA